MAVYLSKMAATMIGPSVNNNNVLSEDLKMNESLFYGEKKMFIFVVAYINMINDVGNLT